jgi:hypothetical protein
VAVNITTQESRVKVFLEFHLFFADWTAVGGYRLLSTHNGENGIVFDDSFVMDVTIFAF